jgi:hypothetical protein
MSPEQTLEVKPLYQTAFGAAPAALTMVLNHYGKKISLEKTTAELSGKSIADVNLNGMAQYASRFFPSPRVEKSNLCDVIDAISDGNPVILFLDLGDRISNPRYIVALGYDLDRRLLVFHNGFSEYLRAPFKLIYEKWEKAGTLALYIDR